MQQTHEDGCCGFDDVRMRGFRERMLPLGHESVTLAKALERTLAEEVRAEAAPCKRSLTTPPPSPSLKAEPIRESPSTPSLASTA